MGLEITVGIQQSFVGHDDEAIAFYDKEFARLSAAVAKKRIEWTEPPPAELPAGVPASRAQLTGFSYGNLHYLRRAWTLHKYGQDVTPVPPGEDLDTELADEEAMNMSSHLLCHADDTGYYIPVDFSDPLFLKNDIVGSSYHLLRELKQVAAPLGINLGDGGALEDEEAKRIAEGALDSPFQNEWEAWLALFETARISIATGHAIVFH